MRITSPKILWLPILERGVAQNVKSEAHFSPNQAQFIATIFDQKF